MTCNKITFADNDKLDREKFAENILDIVSISNELKANESMVIALDSGWGTGKSTFIEMFKNKVKDEKRDIEVIKYNAWDNDDWNDAFVPILNTLVSKVSKLEKMRNEVNSRAMTLLKYIGKGFAKKILDKATDFIGEEIKKIIKDIIDGKVEFKEWFQENIDFEEIKILAYDFKFNEIKELMNQDKINEILFKKQKKLEILDEFSSYKKAKEEFKKMLSDSVDEKIIFIIDELDRCRPTFAIETLESIKHFFDNEKIVFLMAIDMEQLSHSISNVYGQGMDSQGYLKRFIDLNFKLPIPSKNKYVEFLADKYSIDCLKVTQGQANDLHDFLVKNFEALKFTLRDINKFMINFKILLKKSLKNQNNKKIGVYGSFLALKYKYPEVFDSIMVGRLDKSKGNDKFIQLNYIGGFINDNTDELGNRHTGMNKTLNTIGGFIDSREINEGKKLFANEIYFLGDTPTELYEHRSTKGEYIQEKLGLFYTLYNDTES